MSPAQIYKEPQIDEEELLVWKALLFSLPVQDDDQSYWWKVTGRHLAIMMHKAEWPLDRQLESLLFHRFMVVPRLGPQPRSAKPWFKSMIGATPGDGTPIGYSWRWGVDDAKPYIRNLVEPLGSLTGTPADTFNDTAAKEFLWEVGKTRPEVDASLFWDFTPSLGPVIIDKATGKKYSGSTTLLGFQMKPDSREVGVMAYIYPRAPSQIGDVLDSSLAQAMRDGFGASVCLDSLNAVRDFMATDPDGSQLVPTGVTAVECCSAQDARLKTYAATRNTSFNHIAAVMTLGGRRHVPNEMIDQLRDLWYALKGLEDDFPTSAQLPLNDDGVTSPYGLSFHFDIHPHQSIPDVKAYFTVGKHAKNDMAAAEALIGFLKRHGKGRFTDAYLDVLHALSSAEELQTRHGVQGVISASFKKSQLDITSYLNAQVYRRFDRIQYELNRGSMARQRRSLFE